MNPGLKLLPDNQLAEIRSRFPHIAKGWIHFNHASTAPLSTPVVMAMTEYLQERSYGKLETYSTDLKRIIESKDSIRTIINAESTDRLALCGNTSDALNIITSGLPWKSGDQVILNNLEFPANVYPYIPLKKLGVELEVLNCPDGKITADQIFSAVTSRTRAIALSAVQFLSGYRADLKSIGEYCRARGILFLVDGIQAVGAVHIDVQNMNIDALAAGAQKWQLSPQGSGFLYLTETLQSMINQKYFGWLGVVEPWDFFNYEQQPAASARRYEGGTLNIPCIYGMNAALKMFVELGMDRIEQHILSLTRMLIEGILSNERIRLLSPIQDEERAGIVTIQLPTDVDVSKIHEALMSHKILISLREGRIRFSPHFYNTPEEIETTMETLREICCPQH
ncbi:MAG: aminotransferase class V-fold PLP-dependent enzyme [bacterium]